MASFSDNDILWQINKDCKAKIAFCIYIYMYAWKMQNKVIEWEVIRQLQLCLYTSVGTTVFFKSQRRIWERQIIQDLLHRSDSLSFIMNSLFTRLWLRSHLYHPGLCRRREQWLQSLSEDWIFKSLQRCWCKKEKKEGRKEGDDVIFFYPPTEATGSTLSSSDIDVVTSTKVARLRRDRLQQFLNNI